MHPMSQGSPLNNTQPYLFKIHFNIILSWMHRFYWLFFLKIIPVNILYVIYRFPRQSERSVDHRSNILWIVLINHVSKYRTLLGNLYQGGNNLASVRWVNQPHNKRGNRKNVPTKQLYYFFLIGSHFAGLSYLLIIRNLKDLMTFESFKKYTINNTTH